MDPALQHDEHRPEDLDTGAEDHAADALRLYEPALCAGRTAYLHRSRNGTSGAEAAGRRRYAGQSRDQPSAWAN